MAFSIKVPRTNMVIGKISVINNIHFFAEDISLKLLSHKKNKKKKCTKTLLSMPGAICLRKGQVTKNISQD